MCRRKKSLGKGSSTAGATNDSSRYLLAFKWNKSRAKGARVHVTLKKRAALHFLPTWMFDAGGGNQAKSDNIKKALLGLIDGEVCE